MSTPTDELATLRDGIDQLDGQIAESIAERIHVAEDVAEVKSRVEMDLVDERREEDVKSHYEDVFQQQELDPENGRNLAAFLIEMSLEQEREIADSSQDG